MATSDLERIADDSVSLAMKHIFSSPEIYQLDIADGLKQLLYEKKCDQNFLLQSDTASVAGELGIENMLPKL